jgi:predicted Fe-S protein YdhL (DUF1289 family)
MSAVPGRAGPPLSPCIKVCVMDAQRRFCIGCRRTLQEITGWWTMRDDAKRAVLAELPVRAHAPRDPQSPG